MSETKDKILNIIQKSGHDFHLQISTKLEELGWNVTNSPYYNDPDSDRAREIDIIAIKEYPIAGGDGYVQGEQEKLVIKLFIECKYIKSPAVFWFKKRDTKKAIELGKDNNILSDKPDFYVDDGAKHHYVDSKEVSCQWTQENNDTFAEAQHQVLKAMLFFEGHQDSENYEIRYPMIVINSLEQLSKREDAPQNYSSIADNFQLEINYSYKNKNKENATKYFLIDIVSLPLLEEFIKQLESKDIKLLRENIAFDLRQRERMNQAQYEDNDDPYE